MAAGDPPPVLLAEADHLDGAGEDRLVMYRTKIVQFLGRSTPIILQNDNGPCPLLAICNVLLLRNVITLSSDVSEVSQDQLLALVADRLVDSNSEMKSKDEEYVSNQQQNISDAIDLLPRLATGIDVNVHFRKINDFEFTRECAIFDLLDIGLCHGWIVDPEDKDTAGAIGSKSYNTLVGELVALEAQISEDGGISSEEDTVDFAAATAATFGIPSPSLSRGQSFDDPLTVVSTDKVVRKGDLEEEEELRKVLTLSRHEVSTELKIPDKSTSPENRFSNSSSGLEDGTITGASDPFPSVSTEKVVRKGDLEEGEEPMKVPTLLGRGVSTELIHIDKSVSPESKFSYLSSDLHGGTVAGTSDSTINSETLVDETIDDHRTVHPPSFPLSKDGDSSESFNTETSFGVILENNTQSSKSIIADHCDQSKTMHSEVICHTARGSNIPISQPSIAVAAGSDGSNVSGDEKSQMDMPTVTSSSLTKSLAEKTPSHSVDQSNGDSISPGVSQSNVGTGRDSANGHESACSDLEDGEPLYEGEECILDPGRSAYQSQEPFYEGEVILANQVDEMESKATSIQLDKGPSGRKNDGLAAVSREEGKLIHNFLKNNASQLTIYGLFLLQEGLNERELCVFFRNNHFSTMFKFRGELYLLATDQGYVNQPDLVWEKLNEVNGDTIFMTGNFMEFKMDSQNDSWSQQNAMTDTSDYLATIKGSTSEGSSLSTDLQLAIALQEQEFGRQPVCPEPTNPHHTPVPPSRLITGHQVTRRQHPKPEPKSKEKCVVM